jgi:mono/diheme cytochrome c family protein
VAVSLRTNTSVRDTNPHNLIVAILDGLPVHDFPGLARMQEMPGFAGDLDDSQLATLVTWMRQEFVRQSAIVDAEAVRRLRH